MATKRHKKKALSQKHQQQQAHRPGARIQEAQALLQRGDLVQAGAMAEASLRSSNEPDLQQRAKAILAEVYFRQAALSPSPNEQLQRLDLALKQAPMQVRLHYHRGLILWRMGQIPEGVKALTIAYQQQPDRPGLRYLLQLGQVATGKAWSDVGLTDAEKNTLQLLSQVQSEGKKGTIVTPNGKPLLGNIAEILPLLLQMRENSASVPIINYNKAIENAAQTKGGVFVNGVNAVQRYYQGVVAMRKGNEVDAQATWSQVTDKLAMPWFVENLRHLRRERASQLAQEGRWQEILPIYQQTVAEVTAVEVDPALAELAGAAHFHLGHAAAEAKQWRVAFDHFSAANNLIQNRLLSQNLALTAESLEDWGTAAEAWRDMVRRRPRRQDHPDYVTDTQVAAIWERIAKCHLAFDDMDEVITCLKNAVKYAPDDMRLRIELVDAFHAERRTDAAENELERILEVNPTHVPALTRLGLLYSHRWDRDALPIWRRVLAVDPKHADAQQGLAHLYVQMARGEPPFSRHYGMSTRYTDKTAIKVLEDGLAELPDHPMLLVELGMTYAKAKNNTKAREYLHQAGQTAFKDVKLMSLILHELLHVDGGEQVKELVVKMYEITGLLPTFWLSQAERVFDCELDNQWAEFFWQEALRAVQTVRGDDTEASILVKIFDGAFHNEMYTTADKYEKQLRSKYPQSGALEYIEATRLNDADPSKTNKTLGVLRKAKANARKAKEEEIVEMVEAFEDHLRHPRMPDLFGGRNPFAELFKNIDEEDLFDAFRRFL